MSPDKIVESTLTNNPRQAQPNEGGGPVIRISHYIDVVVENIPTKPAVYGKVALDMSRLEPWYILKEADGSHTVTVPSDVESFSDDPAVLCALAAIRKLNAAIYIGAPMKDEPTRWARCHEDVDLYYMGIAASLREEYMHAYPSYSGWFGKGYNLCNRLRLSMEGIKPWSIKGSTVPLRKVWTHKGWGETLPSGHKHLEVLLREASANIILKEDVAPSWMIPLSKIRGSKMKKSLAISKLGFLLQPDIDALSTRFAQEIGFYEEVQSNIAHATMKTFIELDNQIERANHGITDLERAAGHIIDVRAKILYPPDKVKGKRKVKKVPLKDKLGELDPTTFINRFGPYEACGIIPFSTNDENVLTQDGSVKTVEIGHQFSQYSERHPAWSSLLMSWWNTEFLPRFG
jgi:hypothetical protein